MMARSKNVSFCEESDPIQVDEELPRDDHDKDPEVTVEMQENSMVCLCV